MSGGTCATELLTLTEVGQLLKTTPGAARGVLDRLKVKPFNLGPGRGLGLRWYRHEILEALERSREPRQKPKKAPAPYVSMFRGRSVAEIVAELTSPQTKQ